MTTQQGERLSPEAAAELSDVELRARWDEVVGGMDPGLRSDVLGEGWGTWVRWFPSKEAELRAFLRQLPSALASRTCPAEVAV